MGKNQKSVLVTGSSGLIGSEAVLFFDRLDWKVGGIDNNLRKHFFGKEGDTSWNLERLMKEAKNFEHHSLDIRNRKDIFEFFQARKFDLIIHCAAQPSHDFAKQDPFLDFDVNAVGTLNLLEAFRLHSPKAVFIHMSTNKVYGDAPNELPLVELESRWDYLRKEDNEGIDETMRIDRSKHSLFGASKVASDIMAQEYARYFGLSIGIFRGSCLTGPNHSGAELHGFLAYLVKAAVQDIEYRIFGYKGKQVRDQLHSHDVITAFYEFYKNPKPGEVYNLGGGRANSASVLEAIRKLEKILGRKIKSVYIDQNREGDHICYITNMKKFKSHFPNWKVSRPFDEILREIWGTQSRLKGNPFAPSHE